MPEMRTTFREDYWEVLRQKLARQRGCPPSSYRILSYPEPDSPFLTVAEQRALPLPTQVLKFLMVLPPDQTYHSWEYILESEHERLSKEFEVKFIEPRQRDRRGGGLQANSLPFPVMLEPDEIRVKLERLAGIRRDEILDEDPGDGFERVSLLYLERPHVPFPSLAEYGVDRGKSFWTAYCDTKKLPDDFRDSTVIFNNFLSEALVSDVETDEPSKKKKGNEPEALLAKLFLTSAWRYRRRMREI